MSGLQSDPAGLNIPVDLVLLGPASSRLAAHLEVILHGDEAVEAAALACEEADDEEGVEVEAGLDQQLVDAALVPEGSRYLIYKEPQVV